MSSNWTAKAQDWTVSWSNASPYLEGSGAVIVEVLRELFQNDGVLVTPTGPTLPAEVSSSEATALILARLYPSATFENFPDIEALWDQNLPEDAVF